MDGTDEPIIIINGVKLTPGEAMTVRVALETWAMELQNDPGCLGVDEHGRRMVAGYLSAIRDIRRIMSAKPR